MYYGEAKCEIVADLGDEVVIEMKVGKVDADCRHDNGHGHFHPEPSVRLLVDKQHVTGVPPDAVYVANEREKILQEAEREAEQIKKKARAYVRSIRLDANERLSESTKRLKETNNLIDKCHGLREHLRVLDGKYKWFVIFDRDFETDDKSYIVPLGDISKYAKNSNWWLADYEKVSSSGNASDTSVRLEFFERDIDGVRERCLYSAKGFETLDEAKAFLLEMIESGKIIVDGGVRDTCLKHEISSDKADVYLKEYNKKEKGWNMKKLDKLRGEVNKLEGEIVIAEMAT